MEQKQEKRRGHSQRGRRGPGSRGVDRRPHQPKPQERPGRDQVDVEQIMRDIRSRIAQRQGIDLSTQQIQDLAARRLESILDPRTIKPSLLDALQRTAGAAPVRRADKAPTKPAFTFEDTTIYDSHRGALRLMRRLLNPLLKLFFNPNPLIHALHFQARLNVEAAERDADRERQQTEWNALHYEIVQRLVTEVSRGSIELKSLSMRIESLDTKVDFNERRVRGIEGSLHQPQSQSRPTEPVAASSGVNGETAPPETATAAAAAAIDSQPSDGTKRRRRRRRGRRPDTSSGETAQPGEPVAMDAPSAPAEGPVEPPPMVELLTLDSGTTPAPDLALDPVLPEMPAEPPPTVEQFTPDSGTTPAPDPALDPVLSEMPAEPPPMVELLALDSGTTPAPDPALDPVLSEMPAEPPPTVEQLALDSGTTPAPDPALAPVLPEMPAEPPPTVEQLALDSGATPALDPALPPAPPETPAKPPPAVEQLAQDSGTTPALDSARLAEEPDAGRNEH